MLQNASVIPADPLFLISNISLWVFATILSLIMALYCLIILRNRDIEGTERRNLITWAIFFLILTISNIVTLYWRYAVSDFLIIEIFERTTNVLIIIASLSKVIHVEISINNLGYYRGYWSTILLIISVAAR